MDTKERLINLLPYYLQNGENINKYYSVLAEFYNQIIDVFTHIIDSRDIDLAELGGLDVIGDIIGQKRTEKCKEDEKYRNRLRTRVMQNNSMGHTEDINNLADAFLGENFIGVRQGYNYKDLENEPAMAEVILSANKIANTQIKKESVTLQCGTLQTGTTTLGAGIGATTNNKLIKTYKSIFIPDLQKAVSTGVRLQYRIKHNKNLIKIKKLDTITFNSTNKKISLKELDLIRFNSKINKIDLKQNFTTNFKSKSNRVTFSENNNITFKNKNNIKISSNINYAVQKYLMCGNTCVSAKMGVLL